MGFFFVLVTEVKKILASIFASVAEVSDLGGILLPQWQRGKIILGAIFCSEASFNPVTEIKCFYRLSFGCSGGDQKFSKQNSKI